MPKITCGIYAIVHTRTGRTYIGQSRDIEGRWRGHRYNLQRGQHHCRSLQVAWTQANGRGFQLTILEECPPQQLSERENHWISSYAPKLYNLTAVMVKVEEPPPAKITALEWSAIFTRAAIGAMRVARRQVSVTASQQQKNAKCDAISNPYKRTTQGRVI